MKVYRVCCYDEIKGLFQGYALLNPNKLNFGFSFTKSLYYARQLYRQGKRFETEQDMMNNWMVTYNIDKFNNYTEIVYTLDWFIQHPFEANHVFSTDIDLTKQTGNILYSLKCSIEETYSGEEEILVPDGSLKMCEGLITEIVSNNPLISDLEEYYNKYYNTPIDFITEK
jgi:hypothetical protein